MPLRVGRSPTSTETGSLSNKGLRQDCLHQWPDFDCFDSHLFASLNPREIQEALGELFHPISRLDENLEEIQCLLAQALGPLRRPSAAWLT